MKLSSCTALIILLTGAAFARIWGAWAIMPTMDEIQFFIIAQGASIADIWERARAEVHPPLVWILRHYLFAISEDFFFHRLVSAFAGLFAVWGSYLLGKELFQNRAAGITLAAFMAFMPAAVTASVTLRNYSFLMLFGVWALLLLCRWLRKGKTHNLLGFAVLIMLAGSSHFSGFLMAGICGLAGGLYLLIQRKFPAFMLLCTAYIPLLALGAFFYTYYLAPGTTIPMWKTYLLATGFTPETKDHSLMAQLVIPIISYFSPFVQAVNETAFSDAAVQDMMQKAVILGSFGLMLLYTLGLIMLRKHGLALLLTLMLWVIAIPLSLADVYAISANRHNFFMLPFFLLPLAALFAPITTRLNATALIMIVIALVTVNEAVIWKDPDLRFKNEDYEAGQSYLHKHLRLGDAIVTGPMGAHFYLHYAQHKGKLPYHTYVDVPYYNYTTLLAPFASPYKPYSSWEPFRDELAKRIEDGTIPTHANVWFVQYGWKSGEVWALMQCEAMHPYMENFMSRENVAIFSIRASRLAELLKNTTAWNVCYHGFKPLVIGTPFPKITLGWE